MLDAMEFAVYVTFYRISVTNQHNSSHEIKFAVMYNKNKFILWPTFTGMANFYMYTVVKINELMTD